MSTLALQFDAAGAEQAEQTPGAALGEALQRRPLGIGGSGVPAAASACDRGGAQIAGSPSGCRASVRQRERMVGTRPPGAEETSRNTVRVGGSSSDFSSALAALTLSSLASSTMTTRQPSPAARWARNERSRRTSSTGMLVAKRLAFTS